MEEIQWFQKIAARHQHQGQIVAQVRPENTSPICSIWRQFSLSWGLSGNRLLPLYFLKIKVVSKKSKPLLKMKRGN
jgi:hypothetical protein